MGYSHKNNRRRNTRKVTRRINKFKLRKNFADDRVAAIWDQKKSLTENYKAVGSLLHVNDHDQIQESRDVRVGIVAPQTIAEILDSEPVLPVGLVGKTNPSRSKNFMKNSEIEYLNNLIEKHGDNVKAMERDIKTNFLQKSAEHLSTRIARMVKFMEEEAGDNK